MNENSSNTEGGNRSTRLGIGAVFLGALLGGAIGFLLRPSVPLVGPLPFSVVISRGSNLQGLDLVLKGTAQTSFNYLLAGVLFGAFAVVLFRAVQSRTVASPNLQ